MRYDDPQLRELLAGEYVLGTLPARARARFERLMRADPELARLVDLWSARLSPLDAPTRPEPPPPRVWQAIEARLPKVVPLRPRWHESVRVWRRIAVGALAAAAALLIFVLTSLPPAGSGGRVVAVLMDKGGTAGWIATLNPRKGEVVLTAVRPQAIDQAHIFELWAISGRGPPKPLGLMTASLAERATLPSAALPPEGGVLAVSLEPAGGSPTGAPTGPVLYTGKVL
jgi:anti-sigma-K factor RskA